MSQDENVVAAEAAPIPSTKAGVGCNRDAVGWASVTVAAGPSSCQINNDVFAHLKKRQETHDNNIPTAKKQQHESPHKIKFQTDIPAQ
jgi:hypothetical protein